MRDSLCNNVLRTFGGWQRQALFFLRKSFINSYSLTNSVYGQDVSSQHNRVS